MILPVREIKKGLTIVSDKTDEINRLKHELYLEKQQLFQQQNKQKLSRRILNGTRKIFGLKEKVMPPIKYSVRANDLAKQIRELSNHADGINATMHNISEWAIAIPRAMLTIALIPPILKYVFHVEKKNKDKAAVQPAPQVIVPNVQVKQTRIKPKSMNEFVGGLK